MRTKDAYKKDAYKKDAYKKDAYKTLNQSGLTENFEYLGKLAARDDRVR